MKAKKPQSEVSMSQVEKRLVREVREPGGEWTWSPGSLKRAAPGLRVSDQSVASTGNSGPQGISRVLRY